MEKMVGQLNRSQLHLLLYLVLSITLSFFFSQSKYVLAADGNTVAHGGYDESTNSCLYCHDVHEAMSDYLLSREETVTELCGTCHDLYTGNPVTDPGWRKSIHAEFGEFAKVYPGERPDLGTASNFSAYNIDYDDRNNAAGHKLGLGNGNITFADGLSTGDSHPSGFGFVDGNYIPGGNVTLNALAGWLDGGGLVAAVDRIATNGLYCASCHTSHGNYGKHLKNSVNSLPVVHADGRGKILSSEPNHGLYGNFALNGYINYNDWIEDGWQWCTKCHDRRRSTQATRNAGIHNHPDLYCLGCHNNYDGNRSIPGYPTQSEINANGNDFPHTSVAQNLLIAFPDEICVTCHVAGSLP